ncbi:MAG: hypothetical protein C4536_05170 [Actinobacteria bacterium]|jgi:hypothetical protein|nr:MAG: hypothetical protein C4536_05170 [Actinomycetota bacterium]
MAVGFPAKYEEVRPYNLHFNYLSNAAVNALNSLGWKYYALTPYQFSAEGKMSLLSWGETMAINIFQDGTVQMLSKCSFPLQWFDWGKNKKNVVRFFAWLDYFLSQMAYAPGNR